ncbi:MAG: hypothetical protein JWO79_3133, partial [Actinomycetia bacterium]|nr:hypothetical protein [Actinomycetes bacterium]
ESTMDSMYAGEKIARGDTRLVDTSWFPSGCLNSDVARLAKAVVGTVSLEATEQNTGYLTIGGGDADQAPGGYASAVWSSTNFSGVTAFTSAVGTKDADGNKPATWGTLWVACQSAYATAKTHFYIDIVGYYAYDILVAPDTAPPPPGAVAKAKNLARLGSQQARAMRKH